MEKQEIVYEKLESPLMGEAALAYLRTGKLPRKGEIENGRSKEGSSKVEGCC
jgi:hypothetical protein